LLEWDFPQEVSEAIFGDSRWDQKSVNNYHDVYSLANSYLDYKMGNADPLPIHADVDDMIKEYNKEFISLEMIFN
jgi:hypothetical protein